MPEFNITYETRERRVMKQRVEAKDEAEAIRLIAEYEVCDTEAHQTDSLEYSRHNVTAERST